MFNRFLHQELGAEIVVSYKLFFKIIINGIGNATTGITGMNLGICNSGLYPYIMSLVYSVETLISWHNSSQFSRTCCYFHL